MSTALPRPKARGLTLIELMIGLAICAVLMSLAVPSFGHYLQRQRLKSAALGLELDLREARFESARRGQPLHLAYASGPDWCYAITTAPDCDCRVQQPCRVKTVRSSDLRGVQLVQSQGARFDPTSGSVDVSGVTAILQTGAGDRVRVSLTPAGRPLVCMLDGSLSSVPGC